MKYTNRLPEREVPDNERFWWMLLRDAVVILFTSMIVGFGIGFSLWAAAKGIID